jgi:hypothetical protein
MRAKSGIEAPVEASGRAPKPGVAGSNPAGGTQNPGLLTLRSGASLSICPISGADSHCTQVWLESFWCAWWLETRLRSWSIHE